MKRKFINIFLILLLIIICTSSTTAINTQESNQITYNDYLKMLSNKTEITNPELILADEPTGALDSKATDSLLTLFNQINEEGQTILMVTHSTKAASHANRILFIKDGEVFHQIYRGNLTDDQLYVKIQDTLTVLTTGGEKHE